MSFPCLSLSPWTRSFCVRVKSEKASTEGRREVGRDAGRSTATLGGRPRRHEVGREDGREVRRDAGRSAAGSAVRMGGRSAATPGGQPRRREVGRKVGREDGRQVRRDAGRSVGRSHILIHLSVKHTHARGSRETSRFIWDFLPDREAHGELVKTARGMEGGRRHLSPRRKMNPSLMTFADSRNSIRTQSAAAIRRSLCAGEKKKDVWILTGVN